MRKATNWCETYGLRGLNPADLKRDFPTETWTLQCCCFPRQYSCRPVNKTAFITMDIATHLCHRQFVGFVTRIHMVSCLLNSSRGWDGWNAALHYTFTHTANWILSDQRYSKGNGTNIFPGINMSDGNNLVNITKPDTKHNVMTGIPLILYYVINSTGFNREISVLFYFCLCSFLFHCRNSLTKCVCTYFDVRGSIIQLPGV